MLTNRSHRAVNIPRMQPGIHISAVVFEYPRDLESFLFEVAQVLSNMGRGKSKPVWISAVNLISG